MTQEEKQLLLIDLCARLPYGVKTKYVKTFCKIKQIVFEERSTSHLFKGGISLSINDIQVWKPYLRPMSSMTEEERKECNKLRLAGGMAINVADYIDWLNAHHFDYRGLIEKGLALEALEGMYEY